MFLRLTLNIGFVFQFHHLLPEFTALENVCVPGWIAGRKTGELEKKAGGLLERLGVSARASHKPNALSGGEQQRVAVARALVNNPGIIFADEPIGSLDHKNGIAIMELFKELNQKHHKTILMVTHNEDTTIYGTRTLHMLDGKVIMDEKNNQ